MRTGIVWVVVCIMVVVGLIACGSSGGSNTNVSPTLIGTWFHSATASSSNQTLTLTDTTWNNNDQGNGGCIETGIYTHNDTSITFTYGAAGGCHSEPASSTFVANYTLTATTLKMYDPGNGTLVADYVRQ